MVSVEQAVFLGWRLVNCGGDCCLGLITSIDQNAPPYAWGGDGGTTCFTSD